jgi:hypothetical protein
MSTKGLDYEEFTESCCEIDACADSIAVAQWLPRRLIASADGQGAKSDE